MRKLFKESYLNSAQKFSLKCFQIKKIKLAIRIKTITFITVLHISKHVISLQYPSIQLCAFTLKSPKSNLILQQ